MSWASALYIIHRPMGIDKLFMYYYTLLVVMGCPYVVMLVTLYGESVFGRMRAVWAQNNCGFVVGLDLVGGNNLCRACFIGYVRLWL